MEFLKQYKILLKKSKSDLKAGKYIDILKQLTTHVEKVIKEEEN